MTDVRSDDGAAARAWAAVKASALRRLGKQVLLGYVALAALGLLIVAVSVAAMFFGWRF
jgi:hypothetical protein